MRDARLPLAVGAHLVLAAVGSPALAEIDFNRDIRPVLADKCFECHGPDEETRKGGLRLDTLEEAIGDAILPGRAAESEFVLRILSHDEDERMPPPESPRQLSDEEIALLQRWIDTGAPFDAHWAFVPPQPQAIPPVEDTDWSQDPLDALVFSHLDREGLSPQPEAPAEVLARRLSLALTGLPPLPEEIRQFATAHEVDPEHAIDTFVDARLASAAYGEHLAWIWMDAARYADTNGYQGDAPRVMWPWRDWLIDALNDNLPFDELTEQMLAGDLMLPSRLRDWESADWIAEEGASELLVATGFLRNHRYDTGSGTIPEESRFENAADRMETVGTVWMGLTLQCARCHTHKFDPIENREYYELLSFFDKVPEVGSALKDASHPYIHTPNREQRRELKALEADARAAHAAFTEAAANLDAAQASWEATFLQAADATSGVAGDDEEALLIDRGLRFRYAKEGMRFDGTRSVETSKDPIALCAGNRAWTISFWVRPEDLRNGAIFSSVEEPERYRPGIQADWIDGRLRLRHVCRWVNSYIEFESIDELDPERWYHVTFRCDGRMQGLAYRASLDGEDGAMHCTHPVTNDSANRAGKAPLVLGGSPLLPGFRGELRDLRFYDRELATDEIHALADPRGTRRLAQIPPAQRTDREARTLRLAFLESEGLPEEVAALRDAAFATEATLHEAIQATPTTMVMQETEAGPTLTRHMGLYDQLGDPVHSATPALFPPLEVRNGESADRLDLARWLMKPDHPLAARVAVNRLWQLVWGRGFVDSPDNFGTQCAEPLHAPLLDWLALEYQRLGWDTKALLKRIVTSRTYRQDSAAPESLWTQDPDNRHLARGPRFRLPIPSVRDQALHLSGRLDPTLGGPPVVLEAVKGKDGEPVKLPYEITDRRRTLYTFWKRNAPHPMLAVFDVADRNQCDVRVRRTNTPLQALVTLNEPGFAASAEALGQRARRSAEGEDDQLHWLWQACTGRSPDQPTLTRLKETLGAYRELAHGDDARAWTALANVLLNLDATLTLE